MNTARIRSHGLFYNVESEVKCALVLRDPGPGVEALRTAYRPEDFRQTSGSFWRVAVDVGDWDNSPAMNSPGQSGDPNSPHYDDLFPLWAADGSFPLLYSREKVEEATERRILLEPKNERNLYENVKLQTGFSGRWSRRAASPTPHSPSDERAQ